MKITFDTPYSLVFAISAGVCFLFACIHFWRFYRHRSIAYLFFGWASFFAVPIYLLGIFATDEAWFPVLLGLLYCLFTIYPLTLAVLYGTWIRSMKAFIPPGDYRMWRFGIVVLYVVIAGLGVGRSVFFWVAYANNTTMQDTYHGAYIALSSLLILALLVVLIGAMRMVRSSTTRDHPPKRLQLVRLGILSFFTCVAILISIIQSKEVGMGALLAIYIVFGLLALMWPNAFGRHDDVPVVVPQLWMNGAVPFNASSTMHAPPGVYYGMQAPQEPPVVSTAPPTVVYPATHPGIVRTPEPVQEQQHAATHAGIVSTQEAPRPTLTELFPPVASAQPPSVPSSSRFMQQVDTLPDLQEIQPVHMPQPSDYVQQ